MAEEILNTAIPEEEAPIAESPIVELTTVEESIPDGKENLKLLHSALSGDTEYTDLVPKDFNKFIEQYKDPQNATLLFQSLRGDKEYSDMIPSDPVKAASMFGVTINAKGLGKPSAVPSPSVSGGSATKERGVLPVSMYSSTVDGYASPKELERTEREKAALPSEQTISVKREEVKQKANMPSAKVIAETTPKMLAEGQQRIIKREAERALFEEKAKQGNFLGMLQNSLIEGFTSTVNNTADLTLYLMSLGGIGVSPEYDAASNQEKARIFSEALDDVGIKKTLDKQLKTASTTQEYTQKRTEEGGAIMEGVVGLAGSAFPMLTPQQSGFFINGFVDSKKEIQEAMPELSPWKQAAYAFTQGAVQVALERAGLSNLIQNKSVTRALSGKVMDAMKTTFGKFTAKEADVFATKVVNAFFAEAETGATQYAVQEGLRQLADALEGEDDKFEFEGSEQFLSNIMKSGISEGVGGVIMKSMAELPKMIKSPLKKKEAAAVNAQTDQLVADMQNPNVSPEAKVAIDKQINDNAEDVAKAYAEDSNKYEALPEESKADLNRINQDIISHEAVLNDPNVSPETKAISEQRIQELEEQGEGILDSAPAPKPTKTLNDEINIGDTVDLTPLVESSKAKVEVQADNISKEDNDKWTSIIDQSTSPRELDKIIDSIDADGQMTPELITAINTKRESLSPQAEAPQTLPEVENAIADLREQEQAENEETYNKYDEAITPLLEQARADIEARREEEHKNWNYDRTKPNPVDAKYDAELEALNKPKSEAQASIAEEAKGEAKAVENLELKKEFEQVTKNYPDSELAKQEGNTIGLSKINVDGKDIYIQAIEYTGMPNAKPVVAWNSKGENVSLATFKKNEDGTWYSMQSETNKSLQRKGIMTAIYDLAEKTLGKISESKEQTPEAKSFWNKRKSKTSEQAPQAKEEAQAKVITKDDVKLKRGEDFSMDGVYNVMYGDEVIGRIYYDRSSFNAWVDNDVPPGNKGSYSGHLGTKEEAIQKMVDRYNDKQATSTKQPTPAAKAEPTIFDDLDATNKRGGIKDKVAANKAFAEKHGEDAAVAKAISSNFEAIADELKAKGIFTKIEC